MRLFESGDRANRLLSSAGVTTAYDGLGNRITSTVSGTTTRHLLDLQPGLTQVLSATTVANVTRYVGAPGELLAQKDSSANWEWMLADGLGSVRGVVSSAAGVLEHRHFDPFGNLFAGAMSQSEYGFTGEPFDSATGMLYLRARHYRPTNGTFVSRDPFEGTMSRPMSRNGYSWVEGRVADGRDASGMIYETPNKWNACLSSNSFAQTPTPSCGDELDECEISYLAHISTGEATGTGSNAALRAIMLAQLNQYRAGGFSTFRVIEQYLEFNQSMELRSLFYSYPGASVPSNSENLISQSQARDAYLAICREGNLLEPTENGLPGYNAAKRLARQLRCVSNSSNELASNLRYENSFCSSVMSKIEEWRNRAATLGIISPYIPYWYPGDANHVIYEGRPRSVVIYSGSSASLHRNWQCPQFEGEPTVHLNNSNDCVQCINGTEEFINGVYSSCRNGTERNLGIPVVACSSTR